MERRSIDLAGVEILTLDEADRLLDMGFLPSLKRVLKAVPVARQTLEWGRDLASRTLENWYDQAQEVKPSRRRARAEE